MPTDGLEYLRSHRSWTLKYLSSTRSSTLEYLKDTGLVALQDMKSIGYLEQLPTKFSCRESTAFISAIFATSGIQFYEQHIRELKSNWNANSLSTLGESAGTLLYLQTCRPNCKCRSICQWQCGGCCGGDAPSGKANCTCGPSCMCGSNCKCASCVCDTNCG
jgi:hypothetical protein